MKIVRFILPLLLFGFTNVLAQNTFDVKFDPSNEYPSDLTGLYRYTKEKVLAFGSTKESKAGFVAIDNKGAFVKTCILNFKRGWTAIPWYNTEENLLYALVDESIGNKPGYPWHLIIMDTNLNLQDDVRLDSTIMGVTMNMSIVAPSHHIYLIDSTILFASGYTVYEGYPNKLYQRMGYIVDKKGRIKKSYNFKSYSRNDEPLCQKSNGEVLWRYRFKDSMNKDNIGYQVSNTNFDFHDKKDSVKIPDFYPIDDYNKSFIPTKDNGFILLAGDDTLYTSVELIKYDSAYVKQWTTIIPGYNIETLQLLESVRGGYFVVSQSVTDTAKPWLFYCLQDLAVSKVSPEGKHLFTAYYGSGTCVQLPKSILQDVDGGIIISAAYNTLMTTMCSNTCSSPRKEWLMKIDTLGSNARIITGISDEVVDKDLKVFPNPVTDVLQVEINSTKSIPDGIKIVEIFSHSGEVLLLFKIANSSKLECNISDLPNGLYFLSVRYDNNVLVNPFLIQR